MGEKYLKHVLDFQKFLILTSNWRTYRMNQKKFHPENGFIALFGKFWEKSMHFRSLLCVFS